MPKHGNFALVPLVSIKQHQKKIAFPMNKVKFDSPLSNRVWMSLEEQELQTAHFNAAVPPSRPVLGLCEGTWYRCTKNASSRDRKASEGFCSADWTI